MKLCVKEAYLTMVWFIDSFYCESKDNDLGALLGDLSPSTFLDCISADPAAWDIWNKIISKFDLKDREYKYVKEDELLKIIELFLNDFAGNCFELGIIYENLGLLSNNNFDSELLERWNKAIKKGKEKHSEHFYGLK
ncbi:hypothetical protein SAMN02745163_02458 [Clostridium cavendishii DSM 21758]|uniref:Uncharacterized protein n=1 Tax=Clostridium cavendishii DSM 21758 TaxID=1121302 RepID=A0A1M6LQH8_9CLOT|nr:hypothetical protein [Clostridium cavendishii]SHJ73451.1 hypothetical protein SAMN02745163_02458 [Clostridium cavendishii DSM 21758]